MIWQWWWWETCYKEETKFDEWPYNIGEQSFVLKQHSNCVMADKQVFITLALY